MYIMYLDTEYIYIYLYVFICIYMSRAPIRDLDIQI